MKRKISRKLSLGRETLNVLERWQLANEVGGKPIPSTPAATCRGCTLLTGMQETCYNC